jgi:hypothetical protein
MRLPWLETRRFCWRLVGSLKCLTSSPYNIIVVSMIPSLIEITGSPWNVLPPGVHTAGLVEIKEVFAINRRRRDLFAGLLAAAASLQQAGCGTIYLDGSFVSAKPRPGDYDACWDPAGVDPRLLNPIFRKFGNERAAQKAAFQGEFFPSTLRENTSNRSFMQFFQVDRHTGATKGILSISLVSDPMLARRTP